MFVSLFDFVASTCLKYINHYSLLLVWGVHYEAGFWLKLALLILKPVYPVSPSGSLFTSLDRHSNTYSGASLVGSRLCVRVSALIYPLGSNIDVFWIVLFCYRYIRLLTNDGVEGTVNLPQLKLLLRSPRDTAPFKQKTTFVLSLKEHLQSHTLHYFLIVRVLPLVVLLLCLI